MRLREKAFLIVYATHCSLSTSNFTQLPILNHTNGNIFLSISLFLPFLHLLSISPFLRRYVKIAKTDASGSHQFDLGWFSVQNLLPLLPSETYRVRGGEVSSFVRLFKLCCLSIPCCVHVVFRDLAVCMLSFETLLCACCLSRPCCVHVVFRDLAVCMLSFETLLCACCLSRPCCVHVTFRDLAVCMLSLLTVVLAMSSIPISHLVWPLS